MSLLGTIALIIMITTWTVDGVKKDLFMLKFSMFITVLICLWWK